MTKRTTYFIATTLITILLITSFYLQYIEGYIPCPLCMLQRFSFVLLGILFFIGVFTYRYFLARLIITGLCILTSISGIFFAARQIYLQQFPSADSSECGVSLEYMLQILPPGEVFRKIFAGSAECVQRGFEFLHLNMAEWTLLWFIGFLILSLCLLAEECKLTRR